MVNIKGAFRVLHDMSIFKKTVILVDDIATSGSILNEAAAALKQVGAKSIWAITAAR